MRAWPRTPANDPFWAASLNLAHHLAEVTGSEVLVGFNEFCGPDIEEAIAQAANRRPNRLVVATPMLTRGGEHAERDIPAAIGRARVRRPTCQSCMPGPSTRRMSPGFWPRKFDRPGRLAASRRGSRVSE